MKSYTSHPTQSLKLGRFQFENGTLSLEKDDAAEFDELLESQPLQVRGMVKTLDAEAAAKVAEQFAQSRMVKGVDTTDNSIGAPNEQTHEEAANAAGSAGAAEDAQGGDGAGEGGDDSKAGGLIFGKSGTK